jgi:carboxypeptidase family protein
MRPKSLGFAAVGVLLCALFLPAQDHGKPDQDSNIRSVSGTVTDATGGPVAGAVVQIKDTKSLLIRSFITQQDGKYHFSGLSTNVDYQLKAEYQGTASGVKRLSLFSGNRTPVVNLKLSK